ncbi:MAG: ABC transporter ATP-binding protein, partial [Lachnospiraceae bacterium]|nr:ABC transporter ATP-binding protein [Lachnospiraceae bacterium]
MKRKGTLRKVLQYIRRYRLLIALSILFAAVTVALTLYVPILVGRAIDCIVGSGQVEFARIRNLILRILLLVAVTAVLQWFMNSINNKITYQVIRDVRNDAFAKLEILPLSYLDSHPTGEIVSRIIADVDQFADGLLMGFTQLFSGVMTILMTLIFMLSIHPKITVVVVVLTPLSLLVASFVAKSTFSMFKLQSETRAEQTTLIDEMIGGQKVVQAFTREERALSDFDEINGRLQTCSLRATLFSSLTNPCTRFINSLVYAAVGVTGAIAAVHGNITVGSLSCFLSYARQYTKPFNEISGVVTELQNALACAGRIFELIEETPQIPDAENAASLCGVQGNVELEHVFFSYREDRKLIEDLNLHVKKGQRVAIVGPTGCGKTTVVNLLMRFYE